MLTLNELEQREQWRSEITAPVTVTTGSAYASGNVLGGIITIDKAQTIGGPISESPLSAALSGVVAYDVDGGGPAIDLFFFNKAPGAVTDKTAFVPSIADLNSLCGYVAIAGGDWVTVGTNGKIAAGVNQQNLHRILKPQGPLATALYCVPVVRATPTFTNGTVQFKFQFDA